METKEWNVGKSVKEGKGFDSKLWQILPPRTLDVRQLSLSWHHRMGKSEVWDANSIHLSLDWMGGRGLKGAQQYCTSTVIGGNHSLEDENSKVRFSGLMVTSHICNILNQRSKQEANATHCSSLLGTDSISIRPSGHC